MYQPESYAVALAFMIVTMLCWGSWANTLKLTPGYRFQLFYWDYVLGLFAGAIAWGLTLGSMGNIGLPFLADISHASSANILWAIVGGIDFNIANLLLVAAIDIAGLAVAWWGPIHVDDRIGRRAGGQKTESEKNRATRIPGQPHDVSLP